MNRINLPFYDESINTSENNSGGIFGVENELTNNLGYNKKTKSILKIEQNEIINHMNVIELNNFILEILENNEYVTHLDLSDFILSKKNLNHLFKIIGNNFPLLEISRLVEKQNAVNITYLGIKEINNTISKEFIDCILSRIKKDIVENIANVNKKKYARVIRDNYKHLTFSIDDYGSIIEHIFSGELNKNKYIKQILDSIPDNDLKTILDESGKNSLSVEDAKNIVLENLDIVVGINKIEGSSLKEKLLSFYKAEISGRSFNDNNDFTENLYSFEKIKSIAAKAIGIENNIISKYNGVKFNYEGIKYDAIINNKLNPILIKHIRKGNNIHIEDSKKDLIDKIKEYIKYLTNGFDFIGPFTNDFQTDEIENIEKQILSGIIDKNLLLNNYKNTLNLMGLNTLSKSKKGLRIFIDIIDMGIMNLTDYREIAGKVAFGEINHSNIDKLLKSGDSVTQKFLILVKKILETYPNAKISLGGDEIFIYMPNIDEKDIVIENISHKLGNLGFKGRITTSFNSNSKIFNHLDNLSAINKEFEKIIEKYFNSDLDLSKTLFLVPSVTNLDIEKSKFSFVNNNISIISNCIKNNFGINELNEVFLNGIFNKKLEIITLKDGKKENIYLDLELKSEKGIFTINIK